MVSGSAIAQLAQQRDAARHRLRARSSIAPNVGRTSGTGDKQVVSERIGATLHAAIVV